MTLTLYILSALVINYPILCSLGLVFPSPITLIFSTGTDIVNMLKSLSPNPVIIDGAMAPKDTRREILDANSEAILHLMPPKIPKDNKKLSDMMDVVQHVASFHELEGNEIYAQVFWGFQELNYLRDEIRTSFEVTIDEPGDPSETIPDPVPVFPDFDDLSIIFDRIKHLQKEYSKPEDKARLVLHASLEFSYPLWQKDGNLIDYLRLSDHINTLCRENDKSQSMDSIASKAASLLFNHIVDGNLNLVDLSHNHDSPLAKVINTSVFKDGKLLYLSHTLFDSIMEPLLKHTNIMHIKRGLARDGVLFGLTPSRYRRTILYECNENIEKASLICLNGEKIKDPDYPESNLIDNIL